jgi:hypothetical protein
MDILTRTLLGESRDRGVEGKWTNHGWACNIWALPHLGDGGIIVMHMLLVYMRKAFGNLGEKPKYERVQLPILLDRLLDVPMNFFFSVQIDANVFEDIAAMMRSWELFKP